MTEYTINWPVVVSAISALVALAALTIGFAKFRMDLYDRRFAIYTATLELFQVSMDNDVDAISRAYMTHITRVAESQYLFSDRSHIYDRLREFQNEAFKIKVLKDQSAQDGPRDHELIRYMYERSIGSGSHSKLEAILQDLEVRLRPYLTYRVFDPVFWRYWIKPKKRRVIAPIQIV